MVACQQALDASGCFSPTCFTGGVPADRKASREKLMPRHPQQQTTQIVGQALIKKDLHAPCSLRRVTANSSNASIEEGVQRIV
jgi:hypothetical protein